MKYRPKPGDLDYRVIEFFTTNPDECLSANDIEAKFDVNAKLVHTRLSAAIEAGALKRASNVDDEIVYSVGTGHPRIKANPVVHPTARPDMLMASGVHDKGNMHHPVLDVDLDKVQLRENVPLPKQGARPRKWDPLLDRMQVGQSCVLPLSCRSAVSNACNIRKTSGLGEFALRRVNDTEVGVWRIK